MRPFILAGCGLLVASFVAPIVLGVEPEGEFADYKSWKPTTDRPYTLTTSPLCRSSSDRVVEKPGPHAMRYISVYVSPDARKAFDSRAEPFPVGTVIVKEKLKDFSDKKPSELGVMIKRDKGWEFVFIGHDGKKFKGAETMNCAACHLSAGHDFVFGSNLAAPR